MLLLNAVMCKGCTYCVKYCPKRIIEMGTDRNNYGHFYPVFKNTEACTSCGICAVMCPESALEIVTGEEK